MLRADMVCFSLVIFNESLGLGVISLNTSSHELGIICACVGVFDMIDTFVLGWGKDQ